MASSASLVSLEVDHARDAPGTGGSQRAWGRVGAICMLCGLVAWVCSGAPSRIEADLGGLKAYVEPVGLVQPGALPARPQGVAPSPDGVVVPPSIKPSMVEPGQIPLPAFMVPGQGVSPFVPSPQVPAEPDYALDMMEIPEGELGSDANILYGFGTVAISTGVAAAAALLASKKRAPVASIRMAAAEAASDDSESGGLLSKVWNDNTKIVFYITVWYLGSIYYNVWNKRASFALGTNAAGAANGVWALAAAQLLVGALFVLPLWATGLRKAPQMTLENWKELLPVGFFAAGAHVATVLSLCAGAVSFAQIVKAAEPVFAAGTNALLLKDIDHPIVYAALIPIIAGVGLASLKELSFTWFALGAAMAANQFAALKNVASKGVMKKDWAKALGAQNNYAVVQILALFCLLPLVALFDLKTAPAVYAQVMAAGTGGKVIKYTALSGLAFYLYNECAFLALSKLSPVTHSVANTVKRVVIIVATCLVFRTPMTPLGTIGCSIAIAGTYFYSTLKKKYAK